MEFGMGVPLPWNHLLSLLEILEVSPERSAALNLLGFFFLSFFFITHEVLLYFWMPSYSCYEKNENIFIDPKGERHLNENCEAWCLLG